MLRTSCVNFGDVGREDLDLSLVLRLHYNGISMNCCLSFVASSCLQFDCEYSCGSFKKK